jgi:hypothetical protein
VKRFLKYFRRPKRRRPLRELRHPGPFGDDPWGQLQNAFAWHSDVTPLHSVNQCAQTCAYRAGFEPLQFWIDEDSCEACKETWSRARIPEIFRFKVWDVPRDESGVVILLRLGEVVVPLDGHARLNKWEKTPGPDFDAIVVRPKLSPPARKSR